MEPQQTVYEKSEKDENVTFPDFRLYYKAILWYWYKKHMLRSMEQNKESRNKPMHIRSISLQQCKQKHKMQKRHSFQ